MARDDLTAASKLLHAVFEAANGTPNDDDSRGMTALLDAFEMKLEAARMLIDAAWCEIRPCKCS